jgi:hypothetical protein
MAEADLASQANAQADARKAADAATDERAGGTGSSAPPRAAGLRRWLRWEVGAFLELFALCGFVIAQPLLDTTGRAPDFFLFYAASKRDIVLLILAATLVPPVALWAVGALTRVAGMTARRAAHLVLLAVGFAALALLLGKRMTPLRDVPLVIAAVAAGVGLAALYARVQALSQFLRFAAVGPLVFALLFVFASPAGALLRPRAEPAGSAAGAAIGQHPPIVVLMLDEFPLISLMRDGQIDAKRYPNIAALSKSSNWYRNATGVSGWTPYAMPAMLTGIYPYKGVAPYYLEYPNNLFTLLGDVYDLKVEETIAQLCPPRECGAQDEPAGGSAHAVLGESATLVKDLLSPAEDTKDPTASFREQTVAPDDRSTKARTDKNAMFRFGQLSKSQPARFVTFLEGLKPSDRPTLHFLHLLLPHTPYRFLPSGTEYSSPGSVAKTGDAYLESAWWQHSMRTQYEPQLEYTDRIIGDFVQRLKSTGLWDKALVVVTADHGVNFTKDYARRQLVSKILKKQGNEQDLLWVPLFLKEPGQKQGKVDDRNWEQVDILPTLASYAGVKVPWRIDGIDERLDKRTRTEKYFYDWPGVRLKVDGTAAAKVNQGWPPLTEPLPGVVGKPVGQFQVRDGGPVAKVKLLDAFSKVDPNSGRLPAFVWGTLPGQVGTGGLVAVAVNGRIGALAPTARESADKTWFAGLVDDENLYKPGANKLELFLVDGGGTTLTRLGLQAFDASG